MTNLNSSEVILKARICKHIYVADLSFVSGDEQICLSSKSDNIKLWHRKLGHIISSLLNELVVRHLVHGIPKIKFIEDKICDARGREKQTRS